MKKSDALKQKRATALDAQKQLLDTRKAETREFTPEEETRFDELQTEIDGFDADIEKELRYEAAEQRAAGVAAATTGLNDGPDGEEREKGNIAQEVRIGHAINCVLEMRELDGAEKEMNDIALQENRDAGVKTPKKANLHIPISFLRATAHTVSEDSGNYGGELVVNQPPRVQMPFAPGDILAELGANRWTGLSGGDIGLPVMGNYDMAWLTETGAITPQKQTATGPSLSPNRLGSAAEISNRLLEQSSISVDATIRALILAGYNRAINAAAINGSGTGAEPTGLLNLAGVQAGSSTDPDVVSKVLVHELIKLVEAANASGGMMAFLGSPNTKHLLQTQPIDAGSGRYLMEMVNELLGQKFVSSNHVPTLSGNEALIYGDWTKLFIGEWGAISVLADPYSASLQNSIRLVLNGHADVAVAQPTAFAKNTWFNATDS